METVMDPTNHWLDQLEKTLGGNLIQDVMDCYLEFKDVPLSVPGKSDLMSAQKLSVGFRSGLLVQCTDIMLCHSFFDNSNFAAGSILVLEEVIVPLA